MSERGSFTTEYMYNDRDYETIRNALDKKDKYLCVAPPATWSNGRDTYTMPIVSGKVGEMSPNREWLTIAEAVHGIVTESSIRIVVMCDAGSIILVTKEPNGDVCSEALMVDEEEGKWETWDL